MGGYYYGPCTSYLRTCLLNVPLEGAVVPILQGRKLRLRDCAQPWLAPCPLSCRGRGTRRRGSGEPVGVGGLGGEWEAKSLTQALKNAIHFLLGPQGAWESWGGDAGQLCWVCWGAGWKEAPRTWTPLLCFS